MTAVDNGTDPYFSPGDTRWPDPTVDRRRSPGAGEALRLLLESVDQARATVPGLRVRIVGDGPLRAELEPWIEQRRAGSGRRCSAT